MDKISMRLIQTFFIVVWGVVVFNVPINVIVKIVAILLSTITFCFFFECVVNTKHRIKNYPRAILLFYVPSFIMMGLHLLLFNISVGIISFFVLALLSLLLLYILIKKSLYIPYFLIISDVSYSKARTLSHQISEQKSWNTLNYVYRILIVAGFFSLLQVIQMFPMRIIGFNLPFIIPFFLLPSYIVLCKKINVSGNEEAKGKFSIISLVLSVFLIMATLFSDPSLLYKGSLKVDTLVNKKSVQQYKVGIVEEDYEDLIVKVKKGTPTNLEAKILKEIEFKFVPVKYNVYFVDDIEDKSKSGEEYLGLTLMQENRAVSYISVENENDIQMLKYVIYHEYCHVLLNELDNLDTLENQYRAFDTNSYMQDYRDEEQLSKYYVTAYAFESEVEDMCEIYAMYKTNPEYIKTNKVYEKKLTLLLDSFLKQYGMRL